MTKSVGVHEAKTHLSRLIEDVAAGDEIVITRRGKAVASLGPPPKPATRLRFGMDEGRFVVPENFDAPPLTELTYGDLDWFIGAAPSGDEDMDAALAWLDALPTEPA
ncbi:MAG: type II toxin-antitoxin system prevent-host-death family antitoxin [Solirubrobacteraceae bacterium]